MQPYEAPTRPLVLDKAAHEAVGTVPVAADRASVPPRAPDVRGTGHLSVWWGLPVGGALLVALLLRPVLSRRR